MAQILADHLTARLAEWTATCAPSSIPAQVTAYARWLALDHVACSVGARSLSPARILLDLFDEQGGSPQATVLANGHKTSLLQATYLNSALSNLLDFDDSFPGAGHPGGTIVSTAIAVAEHRNQTLGQLLDAVIFGYEASIRIGLAIRPSPERYRRVAGYSVWQTFGATVAAGRLLGLSPEQFRHAFGISGLSAPVPNMRKLGLEPQERPFSWTKNNYGWAAQAGLQGALLAAQGFLGSRTIFDGDHGFAVMAGSDRIDGNVMVDGLGDEWLTLRTGFKPYASCRWTHTALEAVTQLKQANPEMTLDQIESIQLDTFFEVSDNLSQRDPTDIIDAQFSVRHLMALQFLDRSPRYGLHETDLTDPAVVSLRRRVDVVEDEKFTTAYLEQRQMPARLTVTTIGGRQHEIVVDELPGSPANPMSDDELRAKYRSMVEPVLGQPATERLENLIMHGEGATCIGDAMRTVFEGNEG